MARALGARSRQAQKPLVDTPNTRHIVETLASAWFAAQDGKTSTGSTNS